MSTDDTTGKQMGNNNEKSSYSSGGETSDKSRSILSELTVDSPTFTFIEYFLRLNLHASTAKIIQAYEVSNPQLTLQFEKRSKVKPARKRGLVLIISFFRMF
jgi:hypothetical protein